MSAGWSRSSWFGDFYGKEQGWVYHFDHGWIYLKGTDESGFWVHDETLGWLYTGKDPIPSFIVIPLPLGCMINPVRPAQVLGLCEQSDHHPQKKLAGFKKGALLTMGFRVMQGLSSDSIDFDDTFPTICLFYHQTNKNDYEKLALRPFCVTILFGCGLSFLQAKDKRIRDEDPLMERYRHAESEIKQAVSEGRISRAEAGRKLREIKGKLWGDERERRPKP